MEHINIKSLGGGGMQIPVYLPLEMPQVVPNKDAKRGKKRDDSKEFKYKNVIDVDLLDLLCTKYHIVN